MKRATIEAMEKVCSGLEDLLEALNAEQNLHVDYSKLNLKTAVADLKYELGQEDVEG